MSIAFDSFWWWREEFDGRPNPYQPSAGTVTKEDSTGSAAAMQRGNVADDLDSSMTLGGNFHEDFSSSYEDLLNWHWPATLTFEDYDYISSASVY